MKKKLLKDTSVRLQGRIKRTLLVLFLFLLLGIVTIFLLIKKEEVRKSIAPSSVSEKSQESSSKADKEKNREPKLAESEKVTPAVEAGSSQNKAQIAADNPDVLFADEGTEGNIKGVKPPPFHPRYQPSSEDPQKTIEIFLEAASAGNPENFQYFLNSEARRNENIRLVPKGWNGSLGTAVVGEKMRGDGNTVKIAVSFYEGKDTNATPIEKIGYFLVKSLGKWLIFDTVLEKE